jgi:cytochrome c peroxidase
MIRWLMPAAVVLAGCEPQGTVGGLPTVDAGDDGWVLSPAQLEALTALSPDPLPSPPPDVSNAWADNPEAAALGKKLFFTTLFSGPLLDGDNNGGPTTTGNKGETGKVACASCHQPGADFSDRRSPGQQISLASGWTRRRAPSLLDVGHSKFLTWDGRRDAAYNQVFGPLESPVEMNSSRLFVAQQVFAHFKADYEKVFGQLPPLDNAARFPPLTAARTGCQPAGNSPQPSCDGTWHGYPGDHAEFDAMTSTDQTAITRVVVNVGKALGAYERLLSCGPSRFDAWIHGDKSALSQTEQHGAQLFVGRGRCVRCHLGPTLSDHTFHNVGLTPKQVASAFLDADDHGASEGVARLLEDGLNTRSEFSDGDDGRLPSAASPGWEGSFKTPRLRCVSRRPSFLHTGQMKSLESVVSFFNAGGHFAGFYGTSELAPLELSDEEQAQLVAFLRALDGPGAAAALTTE